MLPLVRCGPGHWQRKGMVGSAHDVIARSLPLQELEAAGALISDIIPDSTKPRTLAAMLTQDGALVSVRPLRSQDAYARTADVAGPGQSAMAALGISAAVGSNSRRVILDSMFGTGAGADEPEPVLVRAWLQVRGGHALAMANCRAHENLPRSRMLALCVLQRVTVGHGMLSLRVLSWRLVNPSAARGGALDDEEGEEEDDGDDDGDGASSGAASGGGGSGRDFAAPSAMSAAKARKQQQQQKPWGTGVPPVRVIASGVQPISSSLSSGAPSAWGEGDVHAAGVDNGGARGSSAAARGKRPKSQPPSAAGPGETPRDADGAPLPPATGDILGLHSSPDDAGPDSTLPGTVAPPTPDAPQKGGRGGAASKPFQRAASVVDAGSKRRVSLTGSMPSRAMSTQGIKAAGGVGGDLVPGAAPAGGPAARRSSLTGPQPAWKSSTRSLIKDKPPPPAYIPEAAGAEEEKKEEEEKEDAPPAARTQPARGGPAVAFALPTLTETKMGEGSPDGAAIGGAAATPTVVDDHDAQEPLASAAVLPLTTPESDAHTHAHFALPAGAPGTDAVPQHHLERHGTPRVIGAGDFGGGKAAPAPPRRVSVSVAPPVAAEARVQPVRRNSSMAGSVRGRDMGQRRGSMGPRRGSTGGPGGGILAPSRSVYRRNSAGGGGGGEGGGFNDGASAMSKATVGKRTMTRLRRALADQVTAAKRMPAALRWLWWGMAALALLNVILATVQVRARIELRVEMRLSSVVVCVCVGECVFVCGCG
jgi:hypothetical protein